MGFEFQQNERKKDRTLSPPLPLPKVLYGIGPRHHRRRHGESRVSFLIRIVLRPHSTFLIMAYYDIYHPTLARSSSNHTRIGICTI